MLKASTNLNLSTFMIQPSRNPFRISDSSYSSLASALKPYDLRATISYLGGLLTVPEYHPETIRIEMVLHLAALHCRGRKRPTGRELANWLERDLGDHILKFQEDPPEDVFVSNVIGPGGNYKIFEGVWEANDYYLQHLLDCITLSPFSKNAREQVRSILALLKLSDLVVERSGLARWEPSPETVPKKRFLGRPKLENLASRVTFGLAELQANGIIPERLAPFLLQPSERRQLAHEVWGHSSLERYPIISFDNHVVLGCPSAVSPAIRRYILEIAEASGLVDELQQYVRLRQREKFSMAVRHLGNSSDLFRGEVPPEVQPTHAVHAAFDVAIVPFDTDKIAQFVLLHDEIDEVRRNGLISEMEISSEHPEGFERYLQATAGYYARRAASGLTILVRGGLGRGARILLSRPHPRIHLVPFNMADFEEFAWSKEASLQRLWKLQEQLNLLETEGVRILDLSGTLNHWAFWVDQKFNLVNSAIPVPSERPRGIQVAPSFVYDLRLKERRRLDVHASPTMNGDRHVVVQRFQPDSYFEGRRERPVYASPELAALGELAGVVEGQHVTVWVSASKPDTPENVRDFLFRVWGALLEWVDRIVPELDQVLSEELPSPLRVRLHFDEPETWESFSTAAGSVPPEAPFFRVVTESATIDLIVPFGFTSLISRPTNDAEQLLVGKLCVALRELITSIVTGVDFDPTTIASRVIPNATARALHIFNAPAPTDYLYAGETPNPRFIEPEDRATHELGLAWSALNQAEASDQPVDITTPKGCTDLLNQMVQLLWERLRDRLQLLNGPELVQFALTNNEVIARDRSWWRRTASALFGLHSGKEDVVQVAAGRESERALAMQSGRILVEMAVPTCMKVGGKLVSATEYDWLAAAVALLLELAADSDAIHGGLAKPAVRIYPNGMIDVDKEFMATVANAYSLESFGGTFRSAAEDYSKLFKAKSGDATREAGPYDDPALAAAFSAEYGISPSHVISALAEFWDYANDLGTGLVVTTRGAVAERLKERRNFSQEEAEALLGMLTIVPRERWDKAPPGFSPRDWIPWHFRRRLSAVARPLITFGESSDDVLLYGAEQVGLSVSYLLEGVRLAWLPNEFFASPEMKRYRGEIADRLGHGFNEEVASNLVALGWSVRTEVQMTQIGASPELGDLDVVAWHPSDPRILLIECKRLQPIQNMGEIVERLNQFKGEAGDRLGKHLRRTRWVEENFSRVRKQLRIGDYASSVLPLLVTNAEVPMRFTQDLALPPEQVVPVTTLGDRFRLTGEWI